MTVVSTAEGGPRVYAGTRFFFKEWPMSMRGAPAGPVIGFFVNVFGPLDLPLSFALDTVFLPVTATVALVKAVR
jgi:uncharacterized protein YceK